MPKIQYEDIRMGERVLAIIERANQIIEEYAEQGYDLTLRQVYYQFVSRGWIENISTEYDRLGGIIQKGRRCGLIDWDYIVDRTRELEEFSHWDGPAEIVEALTKQFHIDLWEGQPNRVEVWIEKDALAGVFERICHEFDVPYLSCRGYTSDSEVWRAGQRLKRFVRGGQPPIILHFGDHDPSGIDMSRDIEDRLNLFSDCLIEVRRLALNHDQVLQYNPPENPAKTSDSRYEQYFNRFGDKSWELDALEPSVLSDLVRNELETIIDQDLFDEKIEQQNEYRAELAAVSKNWEAAVAAAKEEE